MCDLDSDIAGSSKDTQRIEPKPRTQLSSTGRPVCGQESTKRCVLTPKHVDEDQTGTGRPVLVDQKEEHKIDYRVPGLSHAVVEEVGHLRVQELVKRIENHPDREALHADLQQNNVYNPFSKNSKEMIRELGNVELIELCETLPKVQCSRCLLYWNQGVVYCTCGHGLIDSVSRRKFNKLRLDALSIPNYVIKKGPTHGGRHGKTEVQKEYHQAWNAWKRCCKKVDSQGEHFTGIHDRLLRDPIYRESQLAIGWTDQKCKEWDELAQEDHTYHHKEKRPRRMVSYSEQSRQKWAYETSIRFWSRCLDEKSPTPRIRKQVEERLHPHQQRRWHHLQAHRGGTSLTGIGTELI